MRQHYATSDSVQELSFASHVLDVSGSNPTHQAFQDRFGNYIVQRVIETCDGAEKEEAGPRLQHPEREN